MFEVFYSFIVRVQLYKVIVGIATTGRSAVLSVMLMGPVAKCAWWNGMNLPLCFIILLMLVSVPNYIHPIALAVILSRSVPKFLRFSIFILLQGSTSGGYRSQTSSHATENGISGSSWLEQQQHKLSQRQQSR